jgi:hypothetical protein
VIAYGVQETGRRGALIARASLDVHEPEHLRVLGRVPQERAR